MKNSFAVYEDSLCSNEELALRVYEEFANANTEFGFCR